MNAITADPIARADYSAKSAHQGRIARFFQRVTAAQEARAERIVKQHLATFTDADLAELGHSPAQIAVIRTYPAIRATV